ncbi:hypothetical protein YC2023_053671 [Brassica napus]
MMGPVLPAEFSKKHLYLNVLSAGLPCELMLGILKVCMGETAIRYGGLAEVIFA